LQIQLKQILHKYVTITGEIN